MTNEKKLELTLCGMLPYNLMGKVDGKESTDKLLGIYGRGSHSLTICFRVNNHNTVDYDCNLEEFKPLLHSLDKLTEPILEGGLIPIVEIFKEIYNCEILETPRVFKYSDIYAVESKTKEVLNRRIIPDTVNITYSNYSGFKFKHPKNQPETNILFKHPFHITLNQLQLFEKLKEWHFNIYDLPKEMYIEKSTL